MQTPDEAAAAPRPLARPLLKVQVGAVCLAVLLVGAWLAPGRDRDPLSAPPPERAAPLLEERAMGRSREAMAGTIAAAATAAQPFAVRIAASPSGPPRTSDVDGPRGYELSGSGVLVGEGRILTHVDALPPSTGIVVVGVAGPVPASVLGFEPDTGLVLLAAGTGQTAPPFASDGLAAEDRTAPTLAVGVGRTAHGVAAQPAFVTVVDSARLAVGLGDALAPGLPLFDAQGRLLAVTGARGAGEAFVVAAALARLAAGIDGPGVPMAFGLTFQDRHGALAEVFGAAGVIVSDVVEAAPAAAVVEPGTLVLKIDGSAVDGTAAAIAAVHAAARRRVPITLSVRRRGDRASRAVTVAPASAIELWRGTRAPAPPWGLSAGDVFAAEVLARAGVDATAPVLAIEGRPVRTDADARRALRGRPPLVLAVLRDARGRFVAALEPPR